MLQRCNTFNNGIRSKPLKRKGIRMFVSFVALCLLQANSYMQQTFSNEGNRVAFRPLNQEERNARIGVRRKNTMRSDDPTKGMR